MSPKEFLQFFPDFAIQLFDDNHQKGAEKDKTLIKLGKPSAFTKDEIFSLNKRGAGVYFTPNKFPSGGRTKDKDKWNSCTGVNAWIVENDDLTIDEQWKNIKASPLPPSFVVQSKNSLHCYWLAKEGTIDNYERIVKGLIKHFGGDSSCQDISRVFRIPGFLHQKDRANPFLIGIVDEHPELRYDDLDMMWAFPFNKEEPKPLILREINTDDFWSMLGSLDNKSVLVRLSGQPIVNNEMIEFKKRRPVGEHIYVNGVACDGWLDETGMIGSGKRGGPTWIQWIGYYGIAKSEIARWAKDNLVEVKKWCEEHEQKVVEKQIEEVGKVVKKDYELRYTWGTPELDGTFGIKKRGNFIVLASKRSSGKTTFVFDMACKNAMLGHKVLFLSLEMDTKDIKDDFARKYAGITIPEERDYKIPEHKQLAFQRKQDELDGIKNLVLEGMRNIDGVLWKTILATIAKHKNLDLVIIDNLDMISSENRENDLERQKRIVKSILAFTHTEQVPLILIHHYRKTSSEGKDKGMDEMAGSGKIADGADMVLKVSRVTDPNAPYPDKYETTLFLQKCRGYREAVKKVYFIHGTFCDMPPITNNDLIPL